MVKVFGAALMAAVVLVSMLMMLALTHRIDQLEASLAHLTEATQNNTTSIVNLTTVGETQTKILAMHTDMIRVLAGR